MQYMNAVIGINRKLQSHEIDWEERRYEIAKDAMAALLNNPQVLNEETIDGEPPRDMAVVIAKASVVFADILTKELKNTQEEK